MEAHRRKADGRRVFTPQFKQEQVARLERQELTVAELSRELVVAPQQIRKWQRLCSAGSAAAVTANEPVVPLSELRPSELTSAQEHRSLHRDRGTSSCASRLAILCRRESDAELALEYMGQRVLLDALNVPGRTLADQGL